MIRPSLALLSLPLVTGLVACRNTTKAEVDTGGVTTAPVDDDGDGYDSDEDCDDEDASVSPAATEICDGIDNDCDGEVDEEVTSTFYTDGDGDGHGDPEQPLSACELPEGAAASDTDCDDGDASVYPGAEERCDGLDNDCDGEVDEEVTSTWYSDADGDGWGDAESPVEDCDPPEGVVSEAGDCDDGSADINPDATELCDGLDNDCDGDVDEDDAADTSDWYVDQDGDGHGSGAAVQACDAPSGHVGNDGDCDDGNVAISPDATEVCDEVDNDCDGDIDEDDAADATTWYSDADGDSYGDPATGQSSCDQPSGTVADDQDCDDSDAELNPDTTWYIDADGDGYGSSDTTIDQCLQPSGYEDNDDDCDDSDSGVNPAASETWYDGTDADCAGDDDYDADGDGERPYAEGGTDCDDDDATVNEAAGNCRASCTPPSPATLAANDPSGVSDLRFDDDCTAWMTTLISGTDYVYAMDSSGSTTVYTGASNHNMGSLALDPSGSGAFAVSYNNVGYLGVSSGSSIPVVATGGYDSGTNFSNGYLRESASSLAWDSAGCIWVPNFSATGALDCFDTTGSSTTLATLSGYVESVALDPDEVLFASVGSDIIEIDSSGATSTYYSLSDTVLDMVFDINGELYVLTDADEIVLVDSSGSSDSVQDTVTGEGKLAISPDGTLFHLRSQPVGAASYDSWAL